MSDGLKGDETDPTCINDFGYHSHSPDTPFHTPKKKIKQRREVALGCSVENGRFKN
jgi:hypothetical protein